MARKSAPKRKPINRYEGVTDEEIVRRWKTVLPRFIRWAILFVIIAVGLFLYNRVFSPNQTVTNIINVAFQISSIFVVCFAFLIGMAYYYGRDTKKA